MKIEELDYILPHELIAQEGLNDRSRSRLLVLARQTNTLEHRHFADIVDYLQPGDSLVINQSKVIPARFYLRRTSGGRIEGLFLEEAPNSRWLVLLKNAARVKIDEILDFTTADTSVGLPENPPQIKVIERRQEGQYLLEPLFNEPGFAVLERFGIMPLPPYIKRQAGDNHQKNDLSRYQTVYAHTPGSVAAPTAGLHFTPELIQQLESKGVQIARVTLHVGLGTFKPVTADKLEDHQMHHEWYEVSSQAADVINQTKAAGKRVIAVGTTSVRTLESLPFSDGRIRPHADWTNLFITPGCQFHVIDGMITNFHLPRTTLLAMVCALAGKEKVINAYQQAVAQKYRFYSYGDAMLIL